MAAFRGTELDFIRPRGRRLQFKPARTDQLEVPTRHPYRSRFVMIRLMITEKYGIPDFTMKSQIKDGK